MVIATRQKHQLSPLHLKLTLEKTDIEQVHEHRVLDVTIDAEMKCYLDLPPYFAQMCVL